VLIIALLQKDNLPTQTRQIFLVILGGIFISILISLAVSFYIYDLSGLYKLNWLGNSDNMKILNINAGFDETSSNIINRFPKSEITICDFYDPQRHTEISIKRARRKYPPFPNTISVDTGKLPFSDNTFDRSFVILSAHEIRNIQERVQFFKELNRITKSSGEILVTEHLRDINNFFAYTIGFLHFYSRSSWLQIFKRADLIVKQEFKITPFITTFRLERHGS
jgi:ubiquinone/menaquinone biosynthesis C-methylase UbiE